LVSAKVMETEMEKVMAQVMPAILVRPFAPAGLQ
jgi:hypothetical protein